MTDFLAIEAILSACDRTAEAPGTPNQIKRAWAEYRQATEAEKRAERAIETAWGNLAAARRNRERAERAEEALREMSEVAIAAIRAVIYEGFDSERTRKANEGIKRIAALAGPPEEETDG